MGTKTTDFWEAKKYSQNSTLQYRAFMSLINQHHFCGNEHVLDIGCGDGKLSVQLAKMFSSGTVLAIDKSEHMIEFAESNAKASNLSFRLCDVQNLTSLRQKFDVIVSSFALHWVPDKLKAFQEIKECLMPDGKVFLIMPYRNPVTAKIREDMIKTDKWKEYFVDFVDPSVCMEDRFYEQYAITAGLELYTYNLAPVTTYFPNVSALKDFLATLTPHLSCLPNETLKEQFMDELVSDYLAKVPANANGSCSITYIYASLFAGKPAIELHQQSVSQSRSALMAKL